MTSVTTRMIDVYIDNGIQAWYDKHSEWTLHDAQEQDYYTLQWMCSHGDLEAVKYFVDTFKITSGVVRTDNNNAFRMAASQNRIHIMLYLVENFHLTKDDVCAADNEAFRWLVKLGHLESVRWLVERFQLTPSDIRANNNEAFRFACSMIEDRVVPLLKYLQQKAQIQTRDLDSQLFTEACYRQQYAALRWLFTTFIDTPASLLLEAAEWNCAAQRDKMVFFIVIHLPQVTQLSSVVAEYIKTHSDPWTTKDNAPKRSRTKRKKSNDRNTNTKPNYTSNMITRHQAKRIKSEET